MPQTTMKPAMKPSIKDYYFQDDSFLDDEGKTVRDTARAFIEKEVLKNIQRWDKGDISPYATHEEMVRDTARKLGRQIGLFGLNLKDLGKYLGDASYESISYTSYGAALRELEAADSTLRSLVSVQSSLVMFAVNKFGSEEQKKKWLPALHRGEKLGCFGLTEPQGGSDPGLMKTTAARRGSSWILNGNKVWITNGFADLAVVWAKTDEGIRGFLVEKGTPGFGNRSEEKWTFRPGVASSLSFSSCEIPEDNLLPKTVLPAGKDLGAPLSCLTEARYGICWGVIGAARACVEEVLAASKERTMFAVPLAQKQDMQRKLVWCLNEIENAQLVAFQLGRLKDSGRLSHTHVSMAKYNNVSKACEVARMCVEMLPADVFTFDAYHSGRHFRNLEVVKKYEGTHDIHMLIVGREITGLNAF
ncbi:MAG: acyl-CoA dehydrogenase family protein [Elusimicrobia bacterium]|nr:acyl-CoA dehydrogenase family protein [Elusimicrobiota bacterium]